MKLIIKFDHRSFETDCHLKLLQRVLQILHASCVNLNERFQVLNYTDVKTLSCSNMSFYATYKLQTCHLVVINFKCGTGNQSFNLTNPLTCLCSGRSTYRNFRCMPLPTGPNSFVFTYIFAKTGLLQRLARPPGLPPPTENPGSTPVMYRCKHQIPHLIRSFENMQRYFHIL